MAFRETGACESVHFFWLARKILYLFMYGGPEFIRDGALINRR